MVATISVLVLGVLVLFLRTRRHHSLAPSRKSTADDAAETASKDSGSGRLAIEDGAAASTSRTRHHADVHPYDEGFDTIDLNDDDNDDDYDSPTVMGSSSFLRSTSPQRYNHNNADALSMIPEEGSLSTAQEEGSVTVPRANGRQRRQETHHHYDEYNEDDDDDLDDDDSRHRSRSVQSNISSLTV